MTRAPALHGVLVVDKPAGLTSAAVVARARRALGQREVGHTGTLDPMATGVLPLVVGEGTKLAGALLADDKAYEGELELGVRTDTLDLDAGARVLARDQAGAAAVTEAALRAQMARLTGELDQVPPMFSAIKQGGRPLHELARAGEEVERAPRRVRVDRFELTAFTPPRARFAVDCSKGTYVRALARDLGEALGCGAALAALRRTRAGRFTLADAVALEALAEPAQAATRLVSPSDAVSHLPVHTLAPAELADVAHGRPLREPPPALAGLAEGTLCRLLTPAGDLAALVTVGVGGRIIYQRVFNYGLAGGRR